MAMGIILKFSAIFRFKVKPSTEAYLSNDTYFKATQ